MTDHHHPEERPEAPAEPAAMPVPLTHPSGFVIVGGVAAVIGSFMPWLKATAPFVGTFTVSGVDDGGDGMFSAGLGVVLVLVGLSMRAKAASGKAGPWGWAVVLGIVLGALMAFEFSSVSDRINNATSESDGMLNASIGSGLIVAAAGAGAAVLGALMAKDSPG